MYQDALESLYTERTWLMGRTAKLVNNLDSLEVSTITPEELYSTYAQLHSMLNYLQALQDRIRRLKYPMKDPTDV